MTLKDILLHENLNLPLVNDNSKNFIDFLEEKLSGYKNIISSLPNKFILNNKEVYSHVFKENTNKLIEGILNTIRHYYDGKPNLAYTKFEETLTFDQSSILDLLVTNWIKGNNKLYRARVMETNFNLYKEDLFHIPFELRHLVSTQRFSIPGFPSLYLANSVYVAWEELKRPNIDTMQVSQFTPKEDLRIISLINPEHYRYEYLYKENPKEPDEELLHFIFTWPLTAACNIKANNNLMPFVPEYIIPQLLLQFIRNKDTHEGIGYSSTNVYINKDNSKNNFLNYVFPIFENRKNGLCSNLTRQFHLTTPISNQLIKATKEGDDNSYISSGSRELINTDIEFIELIKGRKTFYNYSTFGGIEKYLTYNLQPESIYKPD